MKFLFPAFITLLSFQLSAQEKFTSQLRDIISDSANGFSKFRGEIRVHGETVKMETFTDYVSLVTLEGTRENYISYVQSPELSTYTYSALIADSLEGKKSEKLCDEWKERLVSILGDDFIVKKHEVKNQIISKYGWMLFHNEMFITILSIPARKTGSYGVSLTISYSPYKLK